MEKVILTEAKIMEAIYETFGRCEIAGIVENIIDRIEDYDDYDDILQSLDDELIYFDDQWEILKYYCNPQNADWDYAIELFINDLNEVINRLK